MGYNRIKPALVRVERIDAALLAEVDRAVRGAGALPLTKLTRAKLTPEARAELERRLVARGFERAGKVLRVPLDEQILGLLSGGGRLPRKDVPRRIKGAMRPEINTSIDRLSRAGKLHVVIRTNSEVLAGNTERVLDATELGHLAKLHAQLGAALKKVNAKGPPRSVLREDIALLLGPLERAVRPPVSASASAPATVATTVAASAPATEAVSTREIVTDAIRRMEDPELKLVRVPDLIRSLAARIPIDDIHRALTDAAESGAIELRPEAGSEFLDPEDARLCPPGPRGTVLSYVRRLEP